VAVRGGKRPKGVGGVYSFLLKMKFAAHMTRIDNVDPRGCDVPRDCGRRPREKVFDRSAYNQTDVKIGRQSETGVNTLQITLAW